MQRTGKGTFPVRVCLSGTVLKGFAMPYYFWDSTYILVLIGVVLSLIASARVRTTYAKYSRVQSAGGMTGAEVARRILASQGITDVDVQHVSGNLTDHYDPRTKTVSLSDSVYGSTSVAAAGVAAHECGHVCQHAENYSPLNFRSALVPVANFGSSISWPLIIIGLFIRAEWGYYVCIAGVLLFSLAVLFQLVTLPVEFNASHRAMNILEDTGILGHDELKMTGKVLRAAAMTYVAAAAGAILQLLRVMIIANSSRRD